MRQFFAILVALMLALPSHAQERQFVPVTEMLYPDPPIDLWWSNSWNGYGITQPSENPIRPLIPEGVMVQVDLTQWGVPPDAIAVDVAGLLIITHGAIGETCDLHLSIDGVAFNETTTPAPYIGQTIEAHYGGGQRTNFAVRAPVTNGMIGIRWDGLSNPAPWPTGCAYGVNMVITGVYR